VQPGLHERQLKPADRVLRGEEGVASSHACPPPAARCRPGAYRAAMSPGARILAILAVVATAYERGQASWPNVRLQREDFERHMLAIGADEGHAGDVYLACACALGDEAALRAFDRHFLAEVPRFIGRIESSPDVADELVQALREFLLVPPPGGRARIAGYSGRGSLGGWLRVMAVRRLHRMRRGKSPDRQSDARVVERLVAADPSPEVAALRARHGAELAAALGRAIASLAPRERALLKMHILDGLSIDKLCVAFGVHRATVARWIARLRQRVLDQALAVLRERYALGTAEIESLCNAVRSQLDLSLSGLLEG
jgi:RNA polymerase sigma-70 factor (ECF subfamily)